jgi:hypothetical protein
MYCVSREIRTEVIYIMQKKVDRLCVLVVIVLGYRTEMYSASCELRTEFIYVMQKKVDRFCGLEVRVPGYNPEVRVRLPALPDFLRSSRSGTGSTQPREYN